MLTGKKKPLRHYTIEVTDIESGQSLLVAASWDEDDRRIALAQIMRLAGLPAGAGTDFLEEIPPVDPAKKN